MGWLFLAFASSCLLFMLNAFYPHRRHWRIAFLSFLAGWFTIELAWHHIALQITVTAIFVSKGVLDSPEGMIACALMPISWIGLFSFTRHSGNTRASVGAALDAILDPSVQAPAELAAQLQTPIGRTKLMLPFWFRHSEVQRIGNIPYAEVGGRRNQLDVYRSRRPLSQAPVVLQIHGGGWVFGHKRQQAVPMLVDLASRGFVCVSANYRLSPHATFPEHLIDVKRALIWIRQHIHEYGGDPLCVIVTGGSAGGHLAALVALTPNDPSFQPGYEDVDTSVQACIPLYGVYNLAGIGGQDTTPGILALWEARILKRKRSENLEAFKLASPMHYLRPEIPPFFVIHGTQDTVVPTDSSRHFVSELRRISKNKVVYAELQGAQHSFDGFHSIRTHEVIRGMHRFLAFVIAEQRSRATSPTGSSPTESAATQVAVGP